MAKIELLEQSKNLYKKLTTLQKVIIGASLAALVIVFVLILSASSSGDMAVLYTSLDERDAGKIAEKLKEKGIDYDLKDNGTTILIDKNQLYQTRIELASEGLPESSIVGYEIFDQTNLGMSEFVQKLNYRRALEGELSKTINSIDEVKKSRVHIVIPEKALFEKDQKQPTASVYIHLKTNRSLGRVSVEGIQNLVAGSIEGMKPESVTVLDQKGKILSEELLDKKSAAGLSEAQYQQQEKVEQYLTNKVQTLLNEVLGYGNSEVRVNADLDFTQIDSTITDFDPERQVVRSEQTISDQNNSLDSTNYLVIIGDSITRVSGPAANTGKTKQNIITNYEVTQKVTKTVNEIGNIKRLTVSVLVNDSLKTVDVQGNMKYVKRPQEDINKIEEIVKNAVGFDTRNNDAIYVETIPFNKFEEDLEIVEQQPVPWWKDPENIKLLVLIGAALIVIFLMYRILQSKQVKERLRLAFSLPEHIKVEDEEDIEEEEKEPEELEEIEIDEEDMLLLPTELPDQLLLEGEKPMSQIEEFDEEEGLTFDKDSLAARARAKLDDGMAVEITEETLLKIELKNKVQEYIDDTPMDAVKLIRVFLQQDVEEKMFKI